MVVTLNDYLSVTFHEAWLAANFCLGLCDWLLPTPCLDDSDWLRVALPNDVLRVIVKEDVLDSKNSCQTQCDGVVQGRSQGPEVTWFISHGVSHDHHSNMHCSVTQ